MQQYVRITVGSVAALALGACVVVPARQGPPPPAYRVEYRAPPPEHRVEYRAPPPPEHRIEHRAPPPPPEHRIEYRAAPPPGLAARVAVRFHERQREVAREYYRREYHRHGRCPPGLAKRHNRCTPPGHERHWRRGERLPRDVQVRAVPRDLAVRIGPAPRGYRYVEVAGDILMIAVGTSMVVDAMDDLNR